MSQMSRQDPLIENHTVDYVPLAERHGKARDLFTLWFSTNIAPLPIVTGAMVVQVFHLDLLWGLLAIALGHMIGGVVIALASAQGPRMGIPQMVQSRGQFGRYGAVFIWIVAVLVYWGYVVLNVNLMGATAQQLGLGTVTISGVVLGIVSIVVAIFGYNLLHVGQRYTTVALVAVLGVFVVGLAMAGGFTSGLLALEGTFSFTPFLMVTSAALAYQLSWAFFVSDYSRYMPPTTSHRSIITYTAMGAGFGVFSMEAVGAISAALYPKDALTQGLQLAGDSIYPGFGAVVLVVGGIALLIFNGMCVYGGALTLITAMDSIVPTNPNRSLRIKAIVILGISATIVGVLLPDTFINTTFYTVLAVLAYLMAPWTAVNLVDYFVVRKGQYSVREIFRSDGIYGKWNWRGMAAYVISFVVMIPFMYLPFYQGPVATWFGGVDYAFFVGIPVGGILYWLFCRSLDVRAELLLIKDADANLERDATPIL